jgi:hypothetical protein
MGDSGPDKSTQRAHPKLLRVMDGPRSDQLAVSNALSRVLRDFRDPGRQKAPSRPTNALRIDSNACFPRRESSAFQQSRRSQPAGSISCCARAAI